MPNPLPKTSPMPKKGMQPADYAEVFDQFTANISRYDCGKYCAALNGGQPVCCTTDHAIPIVDKTEFALLKTRSDLWRPYVIKDAQARKLLSDLHKTTCAIECAGADICAWRSQVFLFKLKWQSPF